MALVVAMVVVFAVVAPGAQAATKVIGGFIGGPGGVNTGGLFTQPRDVALWQGVSAADPADDKIFVVEGLGNNSRVQRLDANGNFERIWGKDVVVSQAPGDTGLGFEVCTDAVSGAGNCKRGEPGALKGELNQPSGIGIDQSTGEVYVYDRVNQRVQKFTTDGAFVLMFGRDVNATAVAASASQDQRNLCTQASGDTCQAGLATPAGSVGHIGSGGQPKLDVSPVNGHVFVADATNRRVAEYTPAGAFVRALGWDVVPTLGAGDVGANSFEICTTDCKAGSTAAGTENGRFGSSQPQHVAVDSSGIVYASDVNVNARVLRFDSTQATPASLLETPIAATPEGGPLLAGVSTTNLSLEIDPDTDAAGPDEEHLLAVRDPSASGDTVVQELDIPSPATDPVTSEVDRHVFATNQPINGGIAASSRMGTIFVPISISSAAGTGLIVLSEGGGLPPDFGIVSATDAGSTTAEVRGLVTPNGLSGFRLEYSADGVDWQPASSDRYLAGTDEIAHTASLTGLAPNTIYRVRMVGTKYTSLTTTLTATSTEATFLTDAVAPIVDTFGATGVRSTSALLQGRVNPNGSPTSYWFEYGRTTSYGGKAPAPNGFAGAGATDQVLAQPVTGLDPDTTYHYRLVADNGVGGQVTGPDRTFTTRSATQPPDERAFELVSPPDKVGGSGLSVWYAGVGAHGMAGIPALEGDRFISISYYGGTLADGGHSYGSDAAFGERTPGGWVNKPGFTRPGGFVSSELAKLPLPAAVSADLSLSGWVANSQMQLFAEQAEVWGQALGTTAGAALRDWESDKWEILAPLAPEQQPGGSFSLQNPVIAPGGGYAVVSGEVVGVAGPGDPTNPAFAGSPGDLVIGGSVYIDDVTAGLSDSFPGAGIRSLVNVCTGVGSARTAIPSVDAGGKAGAAACPDALAGRDARLISSGGASMNSVALGVISDDGSRVFFMSPDDGVAANEAACAGVGAVETRCPPQVYVRQRNADGSVATRWISESAVADQDASLLAKAVFEGATPDGDKAFFRTASPLTADDPNGGVQVPGGVRSGTTSSSSADLYMYDFPDAPGADPGDGTLTRISAGPTGAGDANASAGSALRALGRDGSRVYFTTAAPLPGVPPPANGTITTPGGSPTQSATRNLYAYDAGRPVAERWRFVAQLPLSTLFGGCAASGASAEGALVPDSGSTGLRGTVAAGGGNCVRVSGDGGFITFFTDGRLTGDDPDAVTGDVYGYDAETDELSRLSAAQGVAEASYVCVTAGGTVGVGTRCHGDPAIVGLGMQAPLGVVVDPAVPGERVAFFESASRLVAEDNNDVYDVYQWRDGVLSLLSTGAVDAQDATYRGNDRSGRNVYISTRDRLTWRDHDAGLDVYTARVGGGFAEPVEPVVCDVLAGGCHGGGAGSVAAPAAGTKPLTGSDNATVGERKALSLGRVSAAQRRRASRSGVLRVSVRATAAGRVSAVARGRIGKRTRRVAARSVRLAEAGSATLRLRLSRPARVRLRQGQVLRLTVKVTSPGARSRAISVLLPGARS